MTRDVRGVLFDLDGTLMDTPLAIAAVVREVIAGRAGTDVPPEQVRRLVGMPLGPLFAQLLNIPDTDPAVQEAITDYRQLYARHVTPRSRELLYPGVEDGLAALRDLGLKLAVATNKISPVARAMLEAGSILDLFDTVIGADDAPPKPDPRMGLLAAQAIGVPPEQAVMVGDTAYDVLMASGAGMRSVGLTHGAEDEAALREAGATVIFADFPAAVRWLGAHAGQPVT